MRSKFYAYFLLFKALLRKIATVYPNLEEECKRQIQRKEIYHHV